MAPPKVLLFGSGAVGTVYIHILIQSGCDVTAVCRSNYGMSSSFGCTTAQLNIHLPTRRRQSRRLPHRLDSLRQRHPHPPFRLQHRQNPLRSSRIIQRSTLRLHPHLQQSPPRPRHSQHHSPRRDRRPHDDRANSKRNRHRTSLR